MTANHYELLSAKAYYGRHATGFVLLRNGHVAIHLSTKKEIQTFKRRCEEVLDWKEKQCRS